MIDYSTCLIWSILVKKAIDSSPFTESFRYIHLGTTTVLQEEENFLPGGN